LRSNAAQERETEKRRGEKRREEKRREEKRREERGTLFCHPVLHRMMQL